MIRLLAALTFVCAIVLYFSAEYVGANKAFKYKKFRRIEAAAVVAFLIIQAACYVFVDLSKDKDEEIESIVEEYEFKMEEEYYNGYYRAYEEMGIDPPDDVPW